MYLTGESLRGFAKDVLPVFPRGNGRESGVQVIIISGNHDSAARLEAPHALLEMINVTVRGVGKRSVEGELDCEHLVVPLKKGGYCLAVPYLRQGDYPEAESYAQGVRKMYEGLFSCVKGKPGPLVAMGHLQATGSEISEYDRSERTVIGEGWSACLRIPLIGRLPIRPWGICIVLSGFPGVRMCVMRAPRFPCLLRRGITGRE